MEAHTEYGALYMEMLYRETRITQGHYISGAASTMLGLLYRRGREYYMRAHSIGAVSTV